MLCLKGARGKLTPANSSLFKAKERAILIAFLPLGGLPSIKSCVAHS